MDELRVEVSSELMLAVRQELVLFETDLIMWLDNPRNVPALHAMIVRSSGVASMPEIQSWLCSSSNIQKVFRGIRIAAADPAPPRPKDVPVGFSASHALLLGSARDMVHWLSDVSNAMRAARASCLLSGSEDQEVVVSWLKHSNNAQSVFVRIREFMGGPVPQAGVKGLAGLAARASM